MNSNQEESILLSCELVEILNQLKSQGMTREDIVQIFSPLINLTKSKRFTFYNSIKQFMKKNLLIKLIFFTTVLLFISSHFGSGGGGPGGGAGVQLIRFHGLAILRITLIKLLPYWNWRDNYYYSRCLIPNPFFETPNLSPDDCNLCETLERIERVSNVTQSNVIENFIRRETPFVVTDAMDSWPIMKTDQFWFDNITEIYLKSENYKVCNLNTNLRTNGIDFNRLLKRLYYKNNQQWFIHWENCQKELAKSVRQYYRRPYFITNSLDFTGSNWVLMSSEFKGRVYKKVEPTDSLLLMYQIRGYNHIRIIPRDICTPHCPELTITLNEGEILVVTNMLWIFEYIPGEIGDNLAILSEGSSPSMD